METLTIGVVQMNALRNHLDHNLALHTQFVKEAAAAGCQIVMFPELSVTAHFGDCDVTALGEAASPGSKIYEHMRSLEAQHDLIVAYGLMGADGMSEPCLEDQWITAALDPELVESERNSRYSLLRTRRPEVYQELTQLV